jgi:fatty acid desaturase
MPLGAWLVAWHGSLQHEIMHGHPTPHTGFNAALAAVPLSLWIPFAIYRDSHLEHHVTPALTSPFDDPESYYVDAARWRRLGRPARAILTFNNTLLGRLTVGPALVVGGFWWGEARRLTSGDFRYAAVWFRHCAGVAVVLTWVVWCRIPILEYALLFAYPGLSLTLLRSYLEHRPADRQQHRTAIVEGDLLTRLLFLNLNFHAVHHDLPGLPWYALPAAFEAGREAVLAGNGGYFFPGYGTIARRFLLRPKDSPRHPG